MEGERPDGGDGTNWPSRKLLGMAQFSTAKTQYGRTWSRGVRTGVFIEMQTYNPPEGSPKVGKLWRSKAIFFQTQGKFSLMI